MAFLLAVDASSLGGDCPLVSCSPLVSPFCKDRNGPGVLHREKIPDAAVDVLSDDEAFQCVVEVPNSRALRGICRCLGAVQRLAGGPGSTITHM